MPGDREEEGDGRWTRRGVQSEKRRKEGRSGNSERRVVKNE
jgi:hypothetical protein